MSNLNDQSPKKESISKYLTQNTTRTNNPSTNSSRLENNIIGTPEDLLDESFNQSPTIAKRSSFGINKEGKSPKSTNVSPHRLSVRAIKKERENLQRTSNFTFKPTLSALSQRLVMSARLQQQYISSTDGKKAIPKNTRKRWEILYEEDQVKREKFKMQKSMIDFKRESLENTECSFKPQLSKSPRRASWITTKQSVTPQKSRQGTPQQTGRSQVGLFERSQMWKHGIEEKISALQQQKKEQECEGLTFKPDVSRLDRTLLNSKRNILESSMKAVDQFLSRMQKAKNEDKRKQKVFTHNTNVSKCNSQNILPTMAFRPKSPRLSTNSKSPVCKRSNKDLPVTPQKTLEKSLSKSNCQTSTRSNNKSITKSNKQNNESFTPQKYVDYDSAMQSLHSQILSLDV